MTPEQKAVFDDMQEFVGRSFASGDVMYITRAECMEILGLIDRLRVKAEGGRPPARLGVVKIAELPADMTVRWAPDGVPVQPGQFDGTYPLKEGGRTAGYKEPPAPGTGDPT